MLDNSFKNSDYVEDKLMEMEHFIYKVKENNDEYYAKTGKNKKYLTVTYGCQMNEHDSEKLEGMLNEMGYIATSNKEEADLIVYNTCCVRENAELKVYGNLGTLKPLKEKNNDLVIAIGGCMMQQPQVVDEIKKKYRHVDLVFGTHNLHNFPQLLHNAIKSDEMIVEVWEKEGEIIEGISAARKYDIKAFVNIMYGCNNFCTYCIVPYTRGRERSRGIHDIINEVKDLANNGVKEITLLGQNVNSYGNTLTPKIDFAHLLGELNKIDGIERIRFMTSHPKDLSDNLIEAMAKYEKVCEHIHLPLQSGSNEVLKKMNRKYTRETYLNLVNKLKKAVPNIAITTDIIVGFPGETEEDFIKTLELVEEVEFDSAFTFLYSIREGTPAANYKEQVDNEVKHNRFNRLLDKLNAIGAEINERYLGNEVEVLVEGVSKNDESKLMGRTRQNKLVNISGGDHSIIGELVMVKITEVRTFSLNAVLIK
ncbi:MAG: tRNA (N6-isopentenyl adenosine(37)-C2)-methylthiotransferase MiaB [Clostridiales bacterium]|nr:tRNA (N6-isopentenyl adenosine(37)-C2)-methylthiotransferase MiaB [Clostridiales bacterium]